MNDPSNNPTPSPQLPKQKVTALARLMTFKDSIVPRKPPPVVFPPPSWDLDDESLKSSASRSRAAVRKSSYKEPVPTEPPEPTTFAIKLRSLIDSLPTPGTASTATPVPGTPKTSDEGREAPPIPPGMDEGLVKMLASEEIMNGNHSGTSSKRTTKERPSVWSALSGLRTQSGVTPTSPPSTVEGDVEEGFMMYAPLEPEADSQVELATPETIEYVDDPVSPGVPKPSPSKPSTNTGDSISLPPPGPKKVIEKHIWVPSTTQLSILTTWWGYRLYLPPPVMEKLDATSLKATARAAMITTALKWLLDKIPLALVPAQFKPALKLLKNLSPVVGYVGVFIAWSWDRIRSLDKGNGVVLTATWLLPVALLPMSWDAGDIYRPILLPKPEELEANPEPSSASKRRDASAADKSDPANKGKERKKSFFRW